MVNNKNNNLAVGVSDTDLLTALYGQLASIKKTMDQVVVSRERRDFSDNGKRCFKLTKQEIKNMPEHVRRIFIANNFIVSYRITTKGFFEARIRRKNMYIEASGRDFETMRRRFVDRLEAFCANSSNSTAVERVTTVVNHNKPQVTQSKTPKFSDYAQEWLKIKQMTTKPSTFKEYERTFKVDLQPVFGEKHLDEITRTEVQEYLFGIVGESKYRKAEKILLMLNCIFDVAADDFQIPSPIKKVVIPNYQTKSGTALTLDEEERLIKYCKSHKDIEGTSALLVLLYFGLRKSELSSIEIVDDKWLKCKTSKGRLGKVEVWRKIPFTPQVKEVLDYIDFDRARITNLCTISTRMKRLFPNHHPHELRHTFITRCKECGVASEVVSMWAGHSLGTTVTATVYTHYSEQFQLKEAQKVKYM